MSGIFKSRARGFSNHNEGEGKRDLSVPINKVKTIGKRDDDGTYENISQGPPIAVEQLDRE